MLFSRVSLINVVGLAFLYALSSVAISSNSLWDYASTNPLITMGAASDIFSFTTPAGSENLQVSVGITFFSSYSSSTSCSGSLLNKAYNNSCVCPGLAGKTFYITQENLYKIIDTFSPGAIGSVGCARIRDNKNFGSFIYAQTTCSAGTMSCTNPSGSTSALPAELTTGNACTC